MKYLKDLIINKEIFFGYMGESFIVKKGAVIFLRDILYAIKYYYRLKDIELTYSQAENLTNKLTNYLEKENDLIKLDNKTWKVNFSWL